MKLWLRTLVLVLVTSFSLGSVPDPFWASLQGASSQLDGAQLAFLAAGQGFQELGVDVQTRYRIAPETSAEEQLTELGDEMALVASFLPGLAEPWQSTFAQFALNLSRSRGLAAQALEALTAEERKRRSDQLEQILGGKPAPAPVPNAPEGKRPDQAALARAAVSLMVGVDAFLDLRPSEPLGLPWRTNVPGVSGPALGPIPTSAGPLFIGGPGQNTWKVGEAIIVDLGGDDTYHLQAPQVPLEGGASLVVILDLAGNDSYRGSGRGAIAAGLFGLSLVRDLGGDDNYQGQNLTQGAGWFGAGILIDDQGDDTYRGGHLSQGAAGFGLGLLADGAGADRYQGLSAAQGFGASFGAGVLTDRTGVDLYRACEKTGGAPLPPHSPGTAVRWDGGGPDSHQTLPDCPNALTLSHHPPTISSAGSVPAKEPAQAGEPAP